MSHLVALSIGPVQEFIAAARRTRDLFTGSRLLSELSKAAAAAMEREGASLIFPASGSDLEPGSPFLVANILLAEVATKDPKVVLEAGKKASRDHWAAIANSARTEMAFPGVLRDEVWDSQVGDVLELFGVWSVIGTDTNGAQSGYQAARETLMRLLAGRKALRDFRQPAAFNQLPKSSLDGQRDTVLQENRENWPAGIRWQLRAKSGEQLDSVGVIKRVWEGRKPFPSVSRIAADAWLRGIQPRHQDSLRALADACENGIANGNLDITRLRDHEFGRYGLFPFEGGALYANRHEEFTEGFGKDGQGPVPDGVIKAVESLKAALKPLTDQYGEPDPYVAVLVADGDRMGEALSATPSPDGHREFSRALAGFAANARQIVENHQGTLVYSGGDDVLAILPVDQCLACARSLANDFRGKLEPVVPGGRSVPTLSVGIGIGHSVEDLEDLLNYARAAEKNAKKPGPGEGESRNGLAVHVHKRGGGPVQVRGNWNLGNPEASIDHELLAIAGLINAKEGDRLPSRFASELVVLAREYSQWPASNTTVDAIKEDIFRVLRKKAGKIAENPQMTTFVESAFVKPLEDYSAAVLRLAEKILVARQIAVGMRMAKGVNR